MTRGAPNRRKNAGNTVGRLGLVGLLLSAACTLSRPADAQATAPVTPKSWGRYTLKLSPSPTAGTQVGSQTLTLLDGKKVVLKVSGFFVSAELQLLRPGGLPELVVSSFSGGAHCCTTYLIYTQDNGRLENMGILDMGNYGVGFQDLNGDGNKEVIVQSDNLAYYDWSYAESPDLKTVLGWDGLRLADRTRFYAYLPAQNAAYYLKQAREVPTTDATYFDSLKSMVSGYFGNLILAGKGVEAEKLIMDQFFPRSPLLKAWWPKHRNELIGLTYGQPEARITVSNTAVWPKPDENTDSP
ncbi:hypothetical protein Q0M94_14535 [Deinococcus radiomollis]|uniref:hypothetical protein n=1 Tax=Deinococcus radiomollis TaxID=468916 RepID=UPI0038926B72